MKPRKVYSNATDTSNAHPSMSWTLEKGEKRDTPRLKSGHVDNISWMEVQDKQGRLTSVAKPTDSFSYN